jgi:hypothetical protein
MSTVVVTLRRGNVHCREEIKLSVYYITAGANLRANGH